MNYLSGDCRRGGVLLALVLVSATMAPTVATANTDAPDPSASGESFALAPDSVAQRAENNTTVHHRNPEEANENGDLDEIQGWLSDRLAERLNKSAIQLSQGEYEAAKSVLDEEYRDLLGKYVDVAGETDEESDDETAEQFNETKETQEKYTSAVQEYRETLEEYREARRNGNTTRARRLARRLDELADRVNETGIQLIRNYRTIENLTGADLTTAEQVTRNITRNITLQQAEIREDLFVNTTLTAYGEAAGVSFLEPLVVRGRLTTANGTPIEHGVIQLQAGGQLVRTTTNESGWYRLRYRPILLGLATETLTLRYRPRNESQYLGSSATVSVTIDQVNPTVKIDGVPTEAGFGDELTITGSVAADGIAAPGVPVVVFVGNHRLGTARTTSDGTFTVRTEEFPADIAAGEQELRVAVPIEGRALAGANATRTILVETTGTILTLAGKRIGDRTINLAGRLTTEDGQPIGEQSVAIRMGDRVVGTVTTNRTGAFEKSMTVPKSRIANGTGNVSVTFVAAFDGTGTNLDSTRAETTVLIPAMDPSQVPAMDLSRGLLPAWAWVLLGFISLLGILGALYGLHERLPWYREESAGPASEGATEAAVDKQIEAESTGEPLLALARDRLNAGQADAAIQAGYEAVRTQLENTLDTVTPRTHWEFYRACRDAGLDDDRLDALRRLTEAYERATFAAESVSIEMATETIEASQAFSGQSNS